MGIPSHERRARLAAGLSEAEREQIRLEIRQELEAVAAYMHKHGSFSQIVEEELDRLSRGDDDRDEAV